MMTLKYAGVAVILWFYNVKVRCRVATSLGEKIQGLFKDIQVRFQDLFQRRFTAMQAY